MTTAPITSVAGVETYIPSDDSDRRQGERRQNARGAGRKLVATGIGDDPASSVSSAKPAAPVVPPPAAFAAQILGQPGKKRGLRGGPPVLDAARSTYLSREYSGSNDRRPSPGIRKKTEI